MARRNEAGIKRTRKGSAKKPVTGQKTKRIRNFTKEAEKGFEEANGSTVAVEARRTFYSAFNKTLSLGILGSGIAALVSGFALMTAVNKEEIVKFVAVNEQGQLIKMVPLSQPNLSDEAVIQWTSDALVDTFTFSAYDINYRLNESTAKYFTVEGAEALLKEVKESGNFDAVIERGLFVSMVLEHAPLLIDYQMLNGRYYAWVLSAPAIITYRSGTQTFTNKINVEMVVSRRSLLESSSGLGISKILWTNK